MFQVYKNKIFNIVILIVAILTLAIEIIYLVKGFYNLEFVNFKILLMIGVSGATVASFFVDKLKSEFWSNFLITLNILSFIEILLFLFFHSFINSIQYIDENNSFLSLIKPNIAVFIYNILWLVFYSILLHFAIKYSSFSVIKRKKDYGIFAFAYFLAWLPELIKNTYLNKNIINYDSFWISLVLLFLLLSTSWLRYRDKISFKLFFYLGLVLWFILSFISFVKIG
ncbi:hypothetical protein ACT4R9_08640 [Ornithobacterium rhinotracheale]|uniref:hypothetical protein n=1 Tax=Ornithobacterium rhinotracheale TaxID=28251 RepID=UPI003FA45E9E